jgi:O-antigen/teichoic acid export membrane protein
MKNIFNILIKDIFSYGFFSILSRMTGLILLPLFTRIFSVNEFGVIDTIAIFSNLYVVISSLRISASISRYYNDKSKGIENGELFSTLFILSLCINLIVLFIIINISEQMSYIFTKTYDYTEYISIACISSFFQSLRKIPLMVLRRERKIYRFTFINLITSFLYAILVLVFVYFYNFGLIWIFYSAAIAEAVAFILSLILSKKYFKLSFNYRYIKLTQKYSLPLVPGKFVMWANNQINRIVILMILGLTGIGLFGVGYRIASVVMIFVSIFGRAWGPLSMEIIHSKNRKYIFERVLEYYLGIFFSIGIIISTISPDIIKIIAPPDYSVSVFVIPWIIGSFIISYSGRIVNISTAISENTIHNSSAELIGFIFNILISYLLILNFGIYGAGISLFISQIISKIFILKVSENYTEIKFNQSAISFLILLYVVHSIGFILITYFITDNIVSIIIRYIFGILLFYCVIIKTMDDIFVNRIKEYIKEKNNLIFSN